MHAHFDEFVTTTGLKRIASQLRDAAIPAVGMSLDPQASAERIATSKFGGRPDLPTDFVWPTNKGRPLDFLLQINLADAHEFDSERQLPQSGLLTFFYDLNEQTWGYDPAELGGFRVIHTVDVSNLKSLDVPDDEFALTECRIRFHSMLTLPHLGSRAADLLFSQTAMTDEESDSYYDLSTKIERLYCPPENGGNHHLLGHSDNVQGDMQLEAQLVTNGLYCGNATGYEDPRRQVLEPGAEDWMLLLQLDSDDNADIMWGDCGMLYYWIRKDDLANQRFENVWMTLQCC